MERLAGQREVRLAEGLVLGGVGVHERRDVVGVCLPVVDELGLADELTERYALERHFAAMVREIERRDALERSRAGQRAAQ